MEDALLLGESRSFSVLLAYWFEFTGLIGFDLSQW